MSASNINESTSLLQSLNSNPITDDTENIGDFTVAGSSGYQTVQNDGILEYKSYNIENLPQNVINDLNDYGSKEPIPRSLIPLDNTVKGSRNLGFYSVLLLYIGRMLGSGIFATPSGIFVDCQGSVPLFLLTWIIGAIIAYSGLKVYLEMGSFLPINGATKSFLEFMFPYPKFFISIVFGVFTFLFSLCSTNAIVFGEYIRFSLNYEKNEHESKKLGILLIIFCCLLNSYSNKFAKKFQNMIGTIKLILLSIMILCCLYVLFIPSSITKLPNHLKKEDFLKFPKFNNGNDDITGNFTLSLYITAILKAIYSFGGWTTPHTIQNEIKNPIRTLKLAGPISFFLILILYLMMNLIYLIILPHSEILNSDQLIGALLFKALFGEKLGEFLLSLLIAVFAANNVLVVIYTDSKLIQEIAKEGFLPFSSFFASNYYISSTREKQQQPQQAEQNYHHQQEQQEQQQGIGNGSTPIISLIWHCLISILVILIPKKNVYNYIVSMQIYPNQLFHFIVCFGLLFKLRPKLNGKVISPIRANTFLVYLCLIGSLLIVILPFMPFKNSKADTSFAIIGLTLLSLGGIYWFIFVKLLPYYFNYKIITVVEIDPKDGLTRRKWKKIPIL
ncbi:hypothetical protein BVG19_g4132 [[Candida] boidinii]|nr:hypothetical protein BVG19_g4132 [[Candida] boidinii]OWB51124.1 hypothetical protein B5S27_g2682 [[Candida] boidinii]